MTRWIHDGFADVAYEPVADSFFGFRAFKIAEQGPLPSGPARQLLVHVAEDDEYPAQTDADGVKVPAVRGGLRGVFMSAYQWGDGPNQAMCLRGYPRTPPGGSAYMMLGGKPHSLLLPECDCGFWAYTNNTNGQHVLSVNGPSALGIIQGWGRMVLGPDGFRAEKARICAVAFTDEPEQAPLDSSFSLAADRLAEALAKLPAASAVLVNQLRAVFGLPPKTPTLPQAQPARTSRPWERVEPTLRRAVMAAYPSVRFFPSVRSMLTEFPMSDLAPLLPRPAASDGQEQAS